MSSSRPFLTALMTSAALGAACTPSSSAARQPTSNPDSASEAPRPIADPPAPLADDDVDPAGARVEPRVAPASPPVIARPILMPRPSGPFHVRVVDEANRNLPTYFNGGRTYVMGTIGSRYSIVVSNPTSQRVEAVVSVDGLDAMDGQPANYVEKRGYIVAPYGSFTIDGFRTSYDQVAAFRFSSVQDSYAGRLGQPRDVGVIGVAFFAERAPVLARREPPPPPAEDLGDRHYGPAPSKAMPRPASPPTADNSTPAPSAIGPTGGGGAGRSAAAPSAQEQRLEARRGLGTEFGEARDSHVYTTEFERANAGTPSQIVAIRYNDRAGLLALGIRIPPVYPTTDLAVRETAEPFRTNRFAQPPP